MTKKVRSTKNSPKSRTSNSQSLRVLIVEDSEDDVLLIIRELKKGGYNPVDEWVETAAAMKKALQEKQWDIILCDYKLPKFNAPSAIALLKESNIDIPLIIVSGSIGEETAVECMRLGAQDYIMKHNLSRLCPAIARELKEAETRDKQKQAEEALRESKEKYRLVVENAKEAIIIAQDFKLVFVNRAAVDMIGYSGEILASKPFTEFIHPDDRNLVVDHHIRRLKGEEVPFAYSFRVISQDGTVKWVEFNTAVIQWKERPATLSFLNDITQRKQAEEKLRENEEKYRNIIENMQDGYFELDLAGNFTFVNDAGCRNIGYPREELIGKNNLQYQDETNAQKMYQLFNRLYKTGDPVKASDIEIIRKDGTKGFNEISASLIRGAEGKPIGFRGISRDVTERKWAEKALLDSKAQLNLALLSAHMGMWYWDIINKKRYFDEQVCHLLGIDPVTFTGAEEEFFKVVYPDDLVLIKAALSRTIEQCVPYEVKYRVIWSDGSIHYISARGRLAHDDSGRPARINGIVWDITAQREAQEELLQSEEKYRSLIENAQEGIYQSLVGYLTLNQALAHMLGYDSPEEVLTTITDIARQLYVNPDDRRKLLEMVNEKDSVTDFETEYYKKDGSRIWVSINMHAVRDDQGRLLYYQGINQDITEKKKIEAERQENIARLRKSLGATINAMAVTVETRDPYTAGHQRRVADLARAIAMEMNLGSDQIDGVRMASMIHDIGKISIPSEILTKPTQLTNLEFNLIKTHSQSGYDILKDIEFPWPVAKVVLQHHERMDGSGYPQGIKGNDILLEARIIATADVVESMASHRPYRPALGIEAALEEIEKNKGILYDNTVADACLRLFREKSYHFP